MTNEGKTVPGKRYRVRKGQVAVTCPPWYPVRKTRSILPSNKNPESRHRLGPAIKLEIRACPLVPATAVAGTVPSAPYSYDFLFLAPGTDCAPWPADFLKVLAGLVVS